MLKKIIILSVAVIQFSAIHSVNAGSKASQSALAQTIQLNNQLALQKKQPLASLLNFISSNDPAILEAQANLDDAKAQLKFSKAQRYPNLSFNASERVVGDKPDESTTALVSTMPIYHGGVISSEIKRDRFRQQYSASKKNETVEQTSFDAATLYLQALRAQQLIQAEQLNLQRHKIIVNDLAKVVEHDKGRQHELTQAQSRLQQVNVRVISYQRTKEKALADLSRFTFNYANSVLLLTYPFSWQPLDPVMHGKKSFANHPTLIAQKEELGSVSEEINVKRKQFLPKFDLQLRATEDDESVDVSVNWPLLNRSLSAQTSRARAQQVAAKQRLAAVEADLHRRVKFSIVDADISWQQAQAAQQQIVLSKQVIKLYEMQFKIARRSLLDLLNAYAELSSAEVGMLNALMDFQLAKLNYHNATAQLESWITLP